MTGGLFTKCLACSSILTCMSVSLPCKDFAVFFFLFFVVLVHVLLAPLWPLGCPFSFSVREADNIFKIAAQALTTLLLFLCGKQRVGVKMTPSQNYKIKLSDAFQKQVQK